MSRWRRCRWCSATPRARPTRAPTIASASIQIHARAAAPGGGAGTRLAGRARGAGARRAADALTVRDGVVHASIAGERRGSAISYGELLRGERIELRLAVDAPLKRADEYRIVGQSVPRVDIPAKARGELGLRARHARAGHAARPRGAPAVCGRRPRRLHRQHAGVGRRIVDRAHPRHPRGGRDPRLRRRRGRARGACRTGGVRSCACSWKPWPGLPRARRSRPGAARQPGDAAPAGRRRRRRCARLAQRRRSRCRATTSGRTRCTPRSGRRARVADWRGDDRAAACTDRVGGHAEPACAARRPVPADGRGRHRHRRRAHGSGRLLRPQLRRRRGGRRGAAVARRRRAGARAAQRASRSTRGSPRARRS